MRITLHAAAGDQPPPEPGDERWKVMGGLDLHEKVGTDLVRAYLGKAKMPRGRTLSFYADIVPGSPGHELLQGCYPDGDIRSLSARDGAPFWLLFTPEYFNGRAFRSTHPGQFGQGAARPHEPHPGPRARPVVVGMRLTDDGGGFLTEV